MMNALALRSTGKKYAVQGCKLWNKFWFESNQVESMRLFRFALGLLLFSFYAVRALDLRWFYSQTGLLTTTVMRSSMPMDFRWSVVEWLPSDASVIAFHTLFLVSLLTMAFGVLPRLSAWIAFLLHISFMHRNMSIVFGIDMIATFFLFYLGFARTDSRPLVKESWSAQLGSLAIRLCQVQVCVIYFYSGLEKIKGGSWWRGEAIWTVVANAQLARWNFEWFSHLPIVIILLTYFTLLWEIYFPVLVWFPKLKKPMLWGGVLLHVGIGFMIAIPHFAAIMMLSYFVFLNNTETLNFKRRVKLLSFLRN